MSTMILSRSRWTSTAPGGRSVNWSRIRGIVCHYPAMGRDVGVLSQAQEAARIRGWRNYHVRSLGWSDLGYNYVIGQSGRVYTGRGDRVAAHAVGHNSTTIGVLFIVGDNEALTPAAKHSFRALRTTLRRRGAGSGVWGHTEMSGNSTRCPGPYIMGDIRSGELKGGGVPTGGASVGGSRPSRPWESSPRVQGMSAGEVRKVQQALQDRGYNLGKWGVDGKYGEATYTAVKAAQKALGVAVDGIAGPDTMNALTKTSKPASKPAAKPEAPAFPLPRKAPNDLFYYGPRSGPRTSISGQTRNTNVPNDVVKVAGRWRSKGLARWQQRMIDRGWNELRSAGGADGRFGATTEKVVGQFQKSKGLEVDHKIGPSTWAAAWTEKVT